MAIPQHTIDQILDRTDIVDLIGQRVKLKKPDGLILAVVLFIRKSHLLSMSTVTSSITTALAVRPTAMLYVF